MQRIAFIKLGLGLVATEVLLSGCSADDDSATRGSGGGLQTGTAGQTSSVAGAGGLGANAPLCSTDANLVQTSMASHDHLPLATPITAAEINAGSPTEFALPLEQNHLHTLTFTGTDFSALRAGTIIMKTSSTTLGHTHTYSIKCV